MVKGKKKIRRRKPGTESKPYFTKHTQAAILEWQDEEDDEKRKQIFEDRIFPAFDKLIENLICVHSFIGEEHYDNLKSDGVAFLYEQLPKFDRTKGFKAFSYYNQIGKNFLTIQAKKRVKTKNLIVLSDDFLGLEECQTLDEYDTVPSPDDQMIDLEGTASTNKILAEIRKNFKGAMDLKIIDCIQLLFANANQFPFLNKRAVFLYIREVTGASPKKLTETLTELRKAYRAIKGGDAFF